MRTAVVAAGFGALLLLAYGASFTNPLLHDDRTLAGSEWVQRQVGPATAFTTDYWHGTRHEGSDLYRPVAVLSIAANARLAGGRAGFRAVNLALHLLASATLFWVVAGVVRSRLPAAVAAALFAVHPLGSEAVLWIVGRAELLAAAAGMTALRLSLDAERRPGGGGWRRTASLAAFALALLAKESAACWLLILPSGWVLLTGRRGGYRRGFLVWAGYAAVFGAYLALRGTVVGWSPKPPHFVDNPLSAVDGATRAGNAVVLLAGYAWKAIWPASLSVEYGFDQIPVRPLLPWVGTVAVGLALAWAAAVWTAIRRGAGPVALFLVWVPAAFAVTGNLAFPIGTIFAERLAYLPLAGGCALAGVAAAALGRPRPVIAVTLVLALAGAARTRARVDDYRDLRSLTEATAGASPRAVKALFNAGRTRLRTGAPAAAVEPLERAVAIWPDYARAWLTLSQAYAAVGRAEEAAAAEARAREAAARLRAGPDDERED